MAASKIRIVAIGRIKERYIQEGIAEFEKRLPPFCRLEVIELKDEGMKQEAGKLAKYLEDKDNTFCLDAKGKEYSSEEFADFIGSQEEQITFIIGGPEGIDQSIKENRTTKLISLSKMTFPHEMARLMLIEQIYRAYMILSGRPYHK